MLEVFGKSQHTRSAGQTALFGRRNFVETGTQSEHFRLTGNEGTTIMYSM